MQYTYIFNDKATIKKTLPIDKAILYVSGAIYDCRKQATIEARTLSPKEKEIESNLGFLLSWLKSQKDNGQKSATISIPACLKQQSQQKETLGN